MKVLLIHNFYKSTQIGGEDIAFDLEVKALRKHLGTENVFVYTVSNDNPSITLICIGGYQQTHWPLLLKLFCQFDSCSLSGLFINWLTLSIIL